MTTGDWFLIDDNFDDKLFEMSLVNGLNVLKNRDFRILLGPLNQLAFVVLGGADDLLNVEVRDEQFFDYKLSAGFEAFVDVNGSNQSFQGVAIKRLVRVVCFALAIVFHNLGHTNFFGPAG